MCARELVSFIAVAAMVRDFKPRCILSENRKRAFRGNELPCALLSGAPATKALRSDLREPRVPVRVCAPPH